ncbi:MAG: hypothetical protein QF657_02430 [Candidatus Nitrosopelagicus sp.]|jgi:hypothetical protein|nr:hypothetical protein [Candidatus Nitrosopelagicus sp.]|tara:strand:+ start:40 stop:540 length:501 start_codon:yes stop_codon:yes gene_type:complete
MAKFKKKKFSAEKPDPKDENDDLPEIEATEDEKKEIAEAIESTEATESESKPEPTEDPIDKSATKKLTDRLFWLRIAVAIAGGVIATFAFEDIADVEEKRWTSIGFMIMLFIATAIIAKSWRIKIANRKKYVTTGIGSFVFMYLFIWIFSYTLVNAGTSQSMIPGI